MGPVKEKYDYISHLLNNASTWKLILLFFFFFPLHAVVVCSGMRLGCQSAGWSLVKTSCYIFIQLLPKSMMWLCSCSRRSEPFQKSWCEKSARFPFTNVFYSLIILREGVVKDKDCVRYVFYTRLHRWTCCFAGIRLQNVVLFQQAFFSSFVSSKAVICQLQWLVVLYPPFFPPLNCDKRL